MTIDHKAVEYNVESTWPLLEQIFNLLNIKTLYCIRKLDTLRFSQILRSDFLEAGRVFHTFKLRLSGMLRAFLCAACKTKKFLVSVSWIGPPAVLAEGFLFIFAAI
jgi:hypothetical protein